MKKLLVMLFMFFAAQNAWAIDIHDAKDQGLVGEATSGYLAAVRSPAGDEVNALITAVNKKRKEQFKLALRRGGTRHWTRDELRFGRFPSRNEIAIQNRRDHLRERKR